MKEVEDALKQLECPRPEAVSFRLHLKGISSLKELDKTSDASIRQAFHLDIPNPQESTACQKALSLNRRRTTQPPPPPVPIQEVHRTSSMDEFKAALDRADVKYQTSYLHRLAIKGITSDTRLEQTTVEEILDIFPEASIKGYDNGRLENFINSIMDLKRLTAQSAPSTNSSVCWHPRGEPEGLWNIQLLARGEELNLWQIGYILEEIYDESKTASFREKLKGGSWTANTFHKRRLALGCSFINETLELDRTLPPQVHTTLRPTRSIQVAKATRPHEPGSAADTLYQQERKHLCTEAGIRALTTSRKGSWTGARSGMWCYAAFADEFLPDQPHLPVKTENLVMYAQHFANAGTLMNYINDLKMAHDMAKKPVKWEPSIIGRLTRRAKKMTLRADRPIVKRHDLRRLIALAKQEGDLLGAALYAVASHFTLRGQSEMFPLQVNGRLKDDRILPLEAPGWHSTINFKDVKGRLECNILYARRKNKSQASEVSRRCVCTKLGRDLCGVCCLKELCERAASPSRKIFLTTVKAATQNLRRRCMAIEIQHGLRMGWHAFRRGSASDMLADGEPISAILRAGGWKGPAALTYLARSELDKKLELIQEVDASDTDGEPVEPNPQE